MSAYQSFKYAGLAVLLAVGLTAAALAQDMEARVIVPDAPGGAKFTGCYRADKQIYGPYQFSFCLEQQATYRAKGGGVTCDGKLSWKTAGRDIVVKIERTPCGNGVAWAKASMTCQGTTLLKIKGTLGKVISRALNIPTLSGLRCTYNPSVSGEKNATFNAKRIS
jgi:hypothetical protein